MQQPKNETRTSLFSRLFDVSLSVKGLDGVLEFLGGILLFFVTPAKLNSFVAVLTQHELSQDPHDYIASHMVIWVHNISGSVSLFLSFYLLAHGPIKIVLAIALLRQKYSVYPWAVLFLSIFVVYQLYRFVLSPSLWLIVLTIFDIFISCLTVIEYRRRVPLR